MGSEAGGIFQKTKGGYGSVNDEGADENERNQEERNRRKRKGDEEEKGNEDGDGDGDGDGRSTVSYSFSQSNGTATMPDILNLRSSDALKGFVALSVSEQFHSPDTWRILVAEFISTSAITFFLSLFFLSNKDKPWQQEPLAVLTVGLILGSSLGFLGAPALSPHHVQIANPVLTLALLLDGRIGILRGPLIIFGQIFASIVGTGGGFLLTPNTLQDSNLLCASKFSGLSTSQAFFLNFLISFILFFSLLSVLSDRRSGIAKWPWIYGFGSFISVAIGGVWIGIPANPLFSFSGAVFQSCWQDQWIDWVSVLASVLVAIIFRRFFLWLIGQQRETLFTPRTLSRQTSMSF